MPLRHPSRALPLQLTKGLMPLKTQFGFIIFFVSPMMIHLLLVYMYCINVLTCLFKLIQMLVSFFQDTCTVAFSTLFFNKEDEPRWQLALPVFISFNILRNI